VDPRALAAQAAPNLEATYGSYVNLLSRQLCMKSVTLLYLAFYLFCCSRLERHFHEMIIGMGFNRGNGDK